MVGSELVAVGQAGLEDGHTVLGRRLRAVNFSTRPGACWLPSTIWPIARVVGARTTSWIGSVRLPGKSSSNSSCATRVGLSGRQVRLVDATELDARERNDQQQQTDHDRNGDLERVLHHPAG